MKLKPILLSLSVLIMSFLVGYFIFAWTEPSQAPPEGNVSTPINVGATPQAKAGRISATEFYDYNNPSYFVNPEGDSLLGGMTETNTLRLTPRAQPTTAQEGQMYWDETSHTLCYYNGSEWICLAITAEICDNGVDDDWDNLVDCADSDCDGKKCDLCGICSSGSCVAATDDDACGTIDCDGKDFHYDDGPDSPSGTNYCVLRNYYDIVTDRCKGVGQCKEANSADCADYTDTRVATCAKCKYCNGSSCASYGNGTDCGSCRTCSGGTCYWCRWTSCVLSGWCHGGSSYYSYCDLAHSGSNSGRITGSSGAGTNDTCGRLTAWTSGHCGVAPELGKFYRCTCTCTAE